MKKKILAVLLATGVAATTLLGGSILVSAADDGGNTAQARTLDEIKKDGKIKRISGRGMAGKRPPDHIFSEGNFSEK